MIRRVDLLIVGAGPAGMSAAIVARHHGLKVLVVDEQPRPGGQIWRNVGVNARKPQGKLLGRAYCDGFAVVEQFGASGAEFLSETQAWQVEPGPRALLRRNRSAFAIETGSLLLATGAQERPSPFPGWTLPGVMTVGAAQIALKTSNQIPIEPAWIAGSGPLPLLYATQLLKAGGKLAGFLDTTQRGRFASALPYLGTAVLHGPADIAKGAGWIIALRQQGTFVRHVAKVEGLGTDALEQVRYVTTDGKTATVNASLLLTHEGLVPTIHPTLALGCRHSWDAAQAAFIPELDEWGETSEAGVFVAGDSAGIGGATAACARGEIVALRVAVRAGRLSEEDAGTLARPYRARLRKALAIRPFLDRLYRPRPEIFIPADGTVACRCEEVTVGAIRAHAATGHTGPDQVKAYTRVGMGPCQGRQCSYTVAHLLATAEGRTISDVGLYRVRPPLKPLTLEELAALGTAETAP